MTPAILIVVGVWAIPAIAATWVIGRAAGYSSGQKALLYVAAWTVPLVGPLLDLLTLHTRGQLPWQNPNIEHAADTLAGYSDIPDIGGQDD